MAPPSAMAPTRLRDAIRGLDLRFDNDEEAAFRHSGEMSRFKHVVQLGCVACAFAIFAEIGWASGEDETPWGAGDPRWLHVGVVAAFVLANASLVAVALMGLRRRLHDCVSGETVVTVLYSLLFASFALFRGRCVWLVSPSGHTDEWVERLADEDADQAITTLAVDAAITALCASGTVRAHRMLPLLAFALAFWILGTCMGHASSHVAAIAWAFLLVLCFSAVQGAYRLERSRRAEWVQGRTVEEQRGRLSVQAALAHGMQAVAEHLCDAVVSLSEGGAVCVKHLAIDSFFGRPMLGRSLADAVLESDRERLASAMSCASTTAIPQCLQVTLKGARGTKEAKFLITATGAAHPKFLVGVCSEPASPELSRTSEATLRADCEAALEAQKADNVKDRSASEAVCTTFTGDIFKGGGLERVAALGRDERWWVDPAELKVPLPACILGRGSFGVVAAAVYHGQAVAVKTLPQGNQDVRRLAALLNELRVLRHLRHPNLVLLFGAVIEPQSGSVALVYEMIRGMQLDVVIRSVQPSKLSRFKILYDMSTALRYLHSQSPSIVHSDLKGGNVMVKETRAGFAAKIIDFGLSRFLTKGSHAQGGSLGWSPPEHFVEQDDASFTAVDVFGFGWLVLLTLTGEGPYNGLRGEELQSAVCAALQQQSLPPVSLPEGTPWAVECEALAGACLRFQSRERPSMMAVQEQLKTWLSPSDAIGLDFASARTVLRSIDWLQGDLELQAASGDLAAQPFMQIDVDTAENFQVVHVDECCDPFSDCLPDVGDYFLDWVDIGGDLRLSLRSTMNDIRTGAKVAPMRQMLSGFRLRHPSAKEEGRRVFCDVFFPEGSQRLSLRLRRCDGAPAASADMAL